MNKRLFFLSPVFADYCFSRRLHTKVLNLQKRTKHCSNEWYKSARWGAWIFPGHYEWPWGCLGRRISGVERSVVVDWGARRFADHFGHCDIQRAKVSFSPFSSFPKSVFSSFENSSFLKWDLKGNYNFAITKKLAKICFWDLKNFSMERKVMWQMRQKEETNSCITKRFWTTVPVDGWINLANTFWFCDINSDRIILGSKSLFCVKHLGPKI